MQSEPKNETIVFLERNTFNVPFRRPSFGHEWIDYNDTLSEQIVPRLQDATIAICNKLALREDTLSQLPKLKLIAVAATGVDNIDLDFCRRKGIAVCNTRGYAVNSLPEHALMLMLALRRNLIAYRDDINEGRWHEAASFCLLDHAIGDLNGATLGIIGYGTLGQSMSRLAQAIGMRVLIAEHKRASVVRAERTSFIDVLRESDVISLHCPLTEETKNLIGAEELRLMKREAILINTARGRLVVDEELVSALKNGEISGAGIDVLRVEPPQKGNVLVETKLQNLIVTPHNAWASKQAMQTLADQLIGNLEAFMRDEPRNRVV